MVVHKEDENMWFSGWKPVKKQDVIRNVDENRESSFQGAVMFEL